MRAMATFTVAQFPHSLNYDIYRKPRWVCKGYRPQSLFTVEISSREFFYFTMDNNACHILFCSVLFYSVLLVFSWMPEHLVLSARGCVLSDLYLLRLCLCLKAPLCVSWGRDFIVSKSLLRAKVSRCVIVSPSRPDWWSPSAHTLQEPGITELPWRWMVCELLRGPNKLRSGWERRAHLACTSLVPSVLDIEEWVLCPLACVSVCTHTYTQLWNQIWIYLPMPIN